VRVFLAPLFLAVQALLSVSRIFNELLPMVVCAAVALTIDRIAHLLIRVVPGRPKFLGAVSAQFVVHAITIDGIELFESIKEWMDTVSAGIKALELEETL
jgi:hypothetical protein